MIWGKVYLAGPITGLSYGVAVNWRTDARDWLKKQGIEGFSPMRWKHYLEQESDIAAAGYDEFPLSSARGIVTRDRFDTMRMDLVLVNLLGATKVSIGTCMELGWADAARVPTVLVMEKSGNPHDHAMVNQVAGFRVEQLEHGLEIVKAVLVPEG